MYSYIRANLTHGTDFRRGTDYEATLDIQIVSPSPLPTSLALYPRGGDLRWEDGVKLARVCLAVARGGRQRTEDLNRFRHGIYLTQGPIEHRGSAVAGQEVERAVN